MTATSGTEESGHCTHSVGGAGRVRGGLMFTPPPRLPLGIPIKNGKHAVNARFPFLPSPPSLGHKEVSLEERGPNLKVILGRGENKTSG